ncbi:hypothetical protein [Geodermatophilus sp. SYSU D00766]
MTGDRLVTGGMLGCVVPIGVPDQPGRPGGARMSGPDAPVVGPVGSPPPDPQAGACPAWLPFEALHSQEAQISTMQAGIRAIASGWLLATMGAVAFVTTKDGDDLLLDPAVAISGLSLLGSAGLAALWILDQLVYQSFHNAVFTVGLYMEYRYPCLPPTRTVIALNARRGRGIRPLMQTYYFIPMAALALLAAIALLLREKAPLVVAAGVLALLVILDLAIVWMSQRFRNRPIDRAKDFGDAGFTTYMEGLGHVPSSAHVVLARFDVSSCADHGSPRPASGR